MTFQQLGLPAARVIANIERRKTFPLKRANAAAHECKANGGTALDAMYASMHAGFDRSCEINSLKLSILHAIKLGTGHPLIRARYGERARMLKELPIDTAIWVVDKWYWIERGKSALSLNVLREMRVMLRMLRRSSLRDHLPAILSLVCDD